MTTFRSALKDIVVHDAGWVRLPSGVSITNLPMWDNHHGIFARPGHGIMEEELERRGLRLPTKAELDEKHKLSLHIEPYFLPTTAMVTAAGVPRPWSIKGRDTPQMARYRAANMMTLEWCKKHDAKVFERLEEAEWGGQPVANAGKHWVRDGLIYGWWYRNGRVVQGLSDWHKSEPGYGDYGTTSDAACDCACGGGDTVKVISTPPPPAPPFTSYGDKGDAVRAMQRWLNTQGAHLKVDGDHGPKTQRALDDWRMKQYPDTIPDPVALPTIQFRQARNYRRGRRAPIDLVVIHVGELAEDLVGEDTNAEALMNYCATTSRQCSWHYAGDSDSITQSVKEEDTAWHGGGGGVNDRSIGIELSGYTAQTTDEWHDEYSQKMLRLVAALVADICRRREIPVRKLDADQLKAGERGGICGHNDLRLAFGQTTHHDPGKYFDFEEFLSMVLEHM